MNNSKQNTMKTMKNTENQAITTFEVVANLTADFKKNYLEIVENWLNEEFERKIQIVIDYKSKVQPFEDKYGRINSENLPDPSMWYKLESLKKSFYALPYEIEMCASLRRHTPENFDTRAFASFYQIEERLAKYKSVWFEKEMKKTSKSFDNSLMKIAFAISNIEMNLDTIEVKNVFVDNGIDITLTDGDKQVHAFTIVAWGEIIRPHFRFLIKTKNLSKVGQ